jgi:hypothetical protein
MRQVPMPLDYPCPNTERWRGELSSPRPAYSHKPALCRLAFWVLAWYESGLCHSSIRSQLRLILVLYDASNSSGGLQDVEKTDFGSLCNGSQQ